MKDDVRDNILSPSQWLRILYMLMFALVSWALGIVLTVLIVLQALFSLITGRDNENLRQLGGALSKYYYQILLFLTYQSEEKPFPFAPFPDTPAAPPLDPVGPSPGSGPASSGRHASTMNTPEPVLRPDFVSEHEPEAAGSATASPAPKAAAPSPEDDDVFAGISFTGPRRAAAPPREEAPEFPPAADAREDVPLPGEAPVDVPVAEEVPDDVPLPGEAHRKPEEGG